MAFLCNKSVDIFHLIQKSDLESLTQHLENGGNVHVRNRGGTTPLHEACRSDSRMKLCIILLKYNANPNAKDEVGRTPMHYTATYGTESGICEKLMVKGGDPCCQDEEKKTPLHDSARNGRTKIFRAQTEFSGEINHSIQNKEGRTPLHEAAKNGHHEICSWLLGAGADPNLPDCRGDTPLHLACIGVAFHGTIPKSLKLLVEYGANLVLKNKSGKTPLNILPTKTNEKAWYAWDDYIEKAIERSQYSHRLRETVEINTVKLFICGNSNAGKTTLKKSLVREPRKKRASSLRELLSASSTIPPNEESTDKATVGIDIDKCFIPMAGNIRIWDCAGHIEYHVTHGMFLGVRNAIFMVPYDLSLTNEEQSSTINYWLAFIKCAHDVPKIKPRIVLVGTHLDLLPEPTKVDDTRAEQNLRNARKTYKGFLDIYDEVFALDARNKTSSEIEQLKLKLGEQVNHIKKTTKVPKLVNEMTKHIESWRKENKVLPFNGFIKKVQYELPQQPREDIHFAIPYMQDMGEIYEAKFTESDQEFSQKIVIDTTWLCTEIIAPALARKKGNYRDADVQRLHQKAYYTREELMEHLGKDDKGPEAISFLQHLKLLFYIPKADGLTSVEGKYMIPARLDDNEKAGLLGSSWREEKGPFPEYYGRCIKCKGDTDMLVPSVFPFLQHYILDKICGGKGARFEISSRFLRFVTIDGIQGIVQWTQDKKAIILAVRGKSESDRQACHNTLQEVLDKTNAIMATYSGGTECNIFFISSQCLQERISLQDAYMYGLQELMQAEDMSESLGCQYSVSQDGTRTSVGRVFRRTDCEEVTNVLLQGYDQRCIRQYGMTCRVEWLPQKVVHYLRRLDIKHKMSEDYRAIANMLGISETETQLICNDLTTGQSVTIELLQQWRRRKCWPCVTIGMLHTLLKFMGFVDSERFGVLQQLEKVLIDNGHAGPFADDPIAGELNLSADERNRKLTLKRSWERLVVDVNAKHLVERLNHVIPGDSYQKIKSLPDTRYNRAAELLLESLLLCKGTGWFDEFMQALNDNNYILLVQLLMNEYTTIVDKYKRSNNGRSHDNDRLKPGDLQQTEAISDTIRRVCFVQGHYKGCSQGAAKITSKPLSRQEIIIMLKLDHANIVRFLDFVEVQFTWLIVTEMADKSLRDYLSNKKPDPSLLKRWLRGVTSAVRYLHGGVAGIKQDNVNPIVHGGISATKCLLFNDDIKLTGCGILRHQTVQRDRKVFDAFIAPEVSDPEIGFTPACDVYALGVLFWEMYTQEVPEANSDSLGQPLGDEDRFPREVRDVMDLCWRQDYNDRPKIAEVIAKLLFKDTCC